ncbi:MAG: hypothetical protein IPH49_14300 [Ignavibacteria bacterium]|nr:hypothetical protein [Ignavibacteria bacterium]
MMGLSPWEAYRRRRAQDFCLPSASGRVLVVRGATGEVLDTIYTSTEEWRIRPDVPPMRDVVDISCSRDGKVLCLTAIIGSNYKTVIMDYPSKRIIKDSVVVGPHRCMETYASGSITDGSVCGRS